MRRRIRMLDEEVRRAVNSNRRIPHNFQVNDEVRLLREVGSWRVGYHFWVASFYHDQICCMRDNARIVVYPDAIEHAKQCFLGCYYDSRTPKEVMCVLHDLYTGRSRIRLRYGNSETGRDSLDEHETEGRIGRSTGTHPIPLLIHNSRSMGGGGLLDASIVRITATTNASMRIFYSHPTYHLPEMKVAALAATDEVKKRHPALTHTVLVDGNTHACFTSEEKAQRWFRKMSL